ncbi:NAD(P)-binding domain-containing protein [Streptomyces niveiscabiei]
MVGCVGLGAMGGALASNLVRAGFEVAAGWRTWTRPCRAGWPGRAGAP